MARAVRTLLSWFLLWFAASAAYLGTLGWDNEHEAAPDGHLMRQA